MAPAEPACACAHEDVGGGEQGEEAAAVLLEPLVDQLAEAEVALHEEEGMLHLAADTRLPGFDGLVPLRLDGALPAVDAEGHPGLLLVSRYLGALFGARVAGVAVHHLVVVPHQLARPGDVADIGRSVHHGVDEAAARVDADVALHAEVPLVALPGLVHLGIPLVLLVLGGAGGGDDGGVHDGPAAHHEALLLEQFVEAVEHGLGEAVLLEKMAEVQEGRRIGSPVGGDVDAHEPGHGGVLVDLVLDALVGEGEPDLEEVHAQDQLQINRGTAHLALVVRIVVRADESEPLLPRDAGVHHFKKCAAPGLAVEAVKEVENGVLSGDHGGSLRTGKTIPKIEKLSRQIFINFSVYP